MAHLNWLLFRRVASGKTLKKKSGEEMGPILGFEEGIYSSKAVANDKLMGDNCELLLFNSLED